MEQWAPVDAVADKFFRDAIAAAEASAALLAAKDRQIEALMARMDQLEKSNSDAATAAAAARNAAVQSRTIEVEANISRQPSSEHALGEAMSMAFKGQYFKKQKMQMLRSIMSLNAEVAVHRDRESRSGMDDLFSLICSSHDSD